jgi:hypothetical protein
MAPWPFSTGAYIRANFGRVEALGLSTGVVAGLVPAIHVLLAGVLQKDVDARDKRGHDAEEAT